MFDLKEKDIKKYAGAVIYDRGNTSYLNNDVKEIKITCEKNSTSKLINGYVYSVEERKILNVEIEIGNTCENVDFNCECGEFKNGNKKKACKHIIATFLSYVKGNPIVSRSQNDINSALKLNENNNSIHLSFDLAKNSNTTLENIGNGMEDNVNNKILHKNMNYIELGNIHKDQETGNYKLIKVENNIEDKPRIKAHSKTLLKIEIRYEYSANEKTKSSFIQLAIGESKSYELNDIRSFLIALKHKKCLEISDMFTFSPEKYSFKKEDAELIKLIATTNEFGARKYDGGKIYLDSKELKKFFQIVQNKAIDIVVNNNLYKYLKIIEKDIPLEFEAKKQEESVMVKQISDMPISITAANDYFIYKDNIYKPSAMQNYRYSSFYNDFIKEGKPYKEYSDKDADRLLSLITFKLKDISKSFKVNKPEVKKAQSIPLKIYISIDTKDSDIILKPKFCYGDVEIDPFSPTKFIQSGKIENRNIRDEMNAIEIIKGLHFVLTKEAFVLNESEHIINFIKTGIKSLEKIAEVSCSEEVKNIKIYEASDFIPKINFHNNYLEFGFDIDGVSLRDTKDIFNALAEYEKYYRLRNGNYISLDNSELRRIQDIIGDREIEDRSAYAGYFTVSRNVSISLANEYKRKSVDKEEALKKQRENERLYAEKNKNLKEILMNIEQINDNEFIVPEELYNIMRNYQKTGFKWFKTLATIKLGGILADEMGLGKTLQAIALILSYVEEYKESKKPSIVVAPTSLIYNWENEIQKFAPQLRAVVVHGNQKERRNLIEDLENIDIVITSYGIISKDIEEYKNVEFSYCFIDEAQQIKNSKTLASKSVKQINAEARFALTGTPIENSLGELWSIFDFVMPGYLLSNRRFVEHYEIPITNYGDNDALQSLNNIIKPFILRRLKSEVLYELPPKIEQKLIVEMTDEQKEAYIACLSYAKKSINKEIAERGYNSSHIHILSALTRLRQVCCDPSIILPDFLGESGKMLALDSIIEENVQNNHRILIFSQFVSVLHIIRSRLTRNNIEYLYLDGTTKSQDRIKLVDEFNSGKASVFLISLKAGGFGLNLTGADIVIHFDPWWNPAVEDQATDRAHRIGQTKTVEVIKIITRGTIEEKIVNLHDRKRDIMNSIISDKDKENNFISKLSQSDIEDLFYSN